MFSPVLPGPRWSHSPSWSAEERLEDAPVEAMVEELGVPAESVAVRQWSTTEDVAGVEGEPLMAIDAIRVPGVATEAVLDGLLAWAAVEWDATHEEPPVIEEVSIGELDVLRASFAGDGVPEYLYASGDSAIKVWASEDEYATAWFEALPCGYVDVEELVHEARMARYRERFDL
jgi:hypothetical protein